MKQNFKLTKEEQYYEDNADKFVPIRGEKRKRIEQALREMRKKKAITLRVRNIDLERIKDKAEKEGLPYQTLISSVLHKYADNRLCEKDESLNYGRKRK